MIFKFELKIDYKNPQNIFIFSKNLVSIIKNLFIIDNKFFKDIYLCQIVSIPSLAIILIFSPLSFIFKYNKGLRWIYHLFYLKKNFINDYILDKAEKLNYTRF